jgi:hypothetical protein
MGTAMNPEFVNENGALTTVFGRFKTNTGIICALDHLISVKDADGLPSDGSYSVTLTSAIATTFGISGEVVDQVLPITVAATTDTSVYTKAITVDQGRPNPFKILFGKSGTKISFATYEDQNDDRNAVSRSITSYDSSTGILLFEYSSEGFGSGGYEFYRIYADDVNNVAYLLGHYGKYDGSIYVQFAVSGQPVDQAATLAVSIAWKGETAADGAGNACVDPSNGGIITDNSLACTITGTDITTIGTATIESIRAGHTQVSDYTFPETLVPSFSTPAEVFTSATVN